MNVRLSSWRSAALLLPLAAGSPLLAQNPPCFVTNLGTDLLLGDDATSPGQALGFTFNFGGVAYTDVCVCSNGYIWFGATSVTGGDYSPTEAELLSGAPRFCPLWTDFNPNATGSGHVWFNAVPASGSNPAYALITFDAVYEYGTTNPVSFQVRLIQGDTIQVNYGSNPATGYWAANSQLLGASPGNNAASNLVSFATRPFTTGGDTFAELNPPLTAFPYAGTNMLYVPTVPGYVVTDLPCTPNNLPGPARFEAFGFSCPTRPTIYQFFTASAVDLSNLNFSFLPNGLGGYTMLQVPSPFFTGLTNNLGAGDDTTHAVTLPFAFPYDGNVINAVEVSSNGFVTLTGSNGAGCCAGSVATLLSGQPRIAGLWTDLNASGTGAGAVYADLDTVSGDFCITWDAVAEYNNVGNLQTFQIALKPSGAFDLRYGTVGFATHQSLAGYSYGLGAGDNGSVDLSATTVLDTGPGGAPITLGNVSGSVPRVGTTCNLVVNGLPATSAVCALLIGLFEATPPIALGPLGAPGCHAYVNFLTGPTGTLLDITGGAATAPFSVGIPASTGFVGVHLTCQAATDSVGFNALGVRTSNGARLIIGL